MANKTIGELQAVPVGELPVAPDIYDDTLIPVEQEGRARHMTGAQWKAYGVAAAKEEADRAEAAAIRQPTIGTDGTWLVWDANAEAYVDTDLPARGEKGGKGDKGDPGEPGKNGTNGISPHIGENGNWYVGETDTGVEATAGAAAAEAAADAAQKSASAAETAKGEAEKSAYAAGTSAESASNSATAAQDAKTAAENAAADAYNEASYCASASKHVENLKNDTETAAEEAKQAITLWPIINEKTGTWLVYQASVGDYVDTGENAQGPAGEDGIAPHIGSNGNWFIGEEDTGISATGPKGGKGDTGATGPKGESIANVTSYPDPLDADNNLIAFYLSTGQQVGIIGVRNGSKGSDGRTPVKGEDYFTPADKAELVTAVLAALPVGEEATF